MWGPAHITDIINNVTTANIWVWILLLHCFLRLCCGDAFCTDTLLQTDDVTHRNLYTEQLLCADTLTQRGLCTDKLLHADAFTQRGFYAKTFYTQKFLYTDALHKYAFTHINKGTQALLHTEPFTQRSLCTEQLLHTETFTQENFDAEKIAHTDCTKKFLQTETFTRRNFTQRSFYTENFSAQKPLRTEVFIHSSFYTDPFTHRCLYTEKKSTHRSFCTRFYTRPAFTRRGFASPSWSPTFRVPPLKYSYQIHGAHHCQNWLMDNKTHDLVVNGPERESWGWNTLSYLR